MSIDQIACDAPRELTTIEQHIEEMRSIHSRLSVVANRLDHLKVHLLGPAPTQESVKESLKPEGLIHELKQQEDNFRGTLSYIESVLLDIEQNV